MARTHIPIVAIRSNSMLDLSINVWVDGMYGSLAKTKLSKLLCNSSLLEVVYDIIIVSHFDMKK